MRKEVVSVRADRESKQVRAGSRTYFIEGLWDSPWWELPIHVDSVEETDLLIHFLL